MTNKTVAVKKIHLGKAKEGVNVTALREIKLLKELSHPSIIQLIDAYPHKQNLHIVFEFMESDLEIVIKDKNIVLSPADIKSYMQMTLKEFVVCYKKWVLHRDMSKKCSMLEQEQLGKLVFINYNIWMLTKQLQAKDLDPILFDKVDLVFHWVLEDESPTSDLSWLD